MDGNLTQGFGPLTQVWVTDRVPASNTGTKDNADRPMRLDPPESGVNFLYFALAPQSVIAHVPIYVFTLGKGGRGLGG